MALSGIDVPGSPRRSSIPCVFAGHFIVVPSDSATVVAGVSVVVTVAEGSIIVGSGLGVTPVSGSQKYSAYSPGPTVSNGS